jgi:hypothetical protein
MDIRHPAQARGVVRCAAKRVLRMLNQKPSASFNSMLRMARRLAVGVALGGLLMACSVSGVLEPPMRINTGSIDAGSSLAPMADMAAPDITVPGAIGSGAPSTALATAQPDTIGYPAPVSSTLSSTVSPPAIDGGYGPLPTYNDLAAAGGQIGDSAAFGGQSSDSAAFGGQSGDSAAFGGPGGIAETAVSAPVIGGIGTNTPQALGGGMVGAGSQHDWSRADGGTMSAQGGGLADVATLPPEPAPVVQASPPPVAALPPAARQPVVAPQPEAQQQAGFFSRLRNPTARQQSSAPSLPAAEAACQQRLRRLGVEFRTKPAVGNGNSCGIAHPVEVVALSGNVRVEPATTLNCPMAEAFAQWVKNDLAPSTRKRYLSGIRSIGSMGGYSCRTMNSRRGAPMSEHSKGNAIDIGRITLNSGRTIAVKKPGLFAVRERSLLNTVRSQSCNYFTTVLGPGSDANHADHFHFDLRQRRNGYRHCD